MKVAKRFTLKDAEELYLVPHWSGGFFRVGEKGDLEVTPLGPKGPAASLLEIVEALRDEGRPLPLVLRFPQILGPGSGTSTRPSWRPWRSTATRAPTGGSTR